MFPFQILNTLHCHNLRCHIQSAVLCRFLYVTNISMELTTSPQFLGLKAHLSFYCTAYLRVNNNITKLATAGNLKCCLQ